MCVQRCGAEPAPCPSVSATSPYTSRQPTGATTRCHRPCHAAASWVRDGAGTVGWHWRPGARGLRLQPLAGLLHLCCDAGEVGAAQGDQHLMTVQGGFQGDRYRSLRQCCGGRCWLVLHWCLGPCNRWLAGPIELVHAMRGQDKSPLLHTSRNAMFAPPTGCPGEVWALTRPIAPHSRRWRHWSGSPPWPCPQAAVRHPH